MCQLLKLFFCPGNDSSATHKDKRLFSFLNHLYGLVNIFFPDALCLPEWRLWFFRRILCFRSSDILCNIHQYRTRSPTPGYLKGFAQSFCQTGYIFYNITVFRYRHHNPRNIHFLERILSQQRFAHIGGYSHQRHGIHISSGYSSDQIGGTRTGCGQTYPCFPCGARISVSRMRSSLFMGCENMPDIILILIQSIIYV